MLKTMIAAIFMAACTLFVSAQNCPPLGNRTNGITTNPAAPVNTHRPSRLNWFDWTQPSYLLNLGVTNISATSIPSPFFTTDNGNIVHFYDPADGIRDVSPAQGWELIKMDFGYVNNTTPASPGTTQPYMILYNKFRGILRVFFATVQTFPVTGATVRVVFSSNSGMQTSLLDYQASLKPVDAAFERNPELTSVVEYLQQPLRWWYADYPMQYDPCTCLYSSSLEIHLVFDNVSNINLAGTSTGTLTSLAQSGSPTTRSKTNGTSSVGSFINNLGQSRLKKSIDVYKNSSLYANDITKSIQAAPVNISIQNSKISNLNLFTQETGKTNFLKQGLKALPYIGDAISLLNVFVGGGKEAAAPQQVEIMPMSIMQNIEYTGNISTAIPNSRLTFRTPGSNIPAGSSELDYPFYNEVLGLFNLLRTPTLVHQVTFPRLIIDGVRYPQSVDRFFFQGDLQYVVNPAANLDVQEIQVALLVEPTAGFISAPPDRLGSFTFLESVSPAQRSVWRSTYTDIGCLTRTIYQNTASDAPEYSPWRPEGPFWIKVMVNFRRRDSGPNTQNVLYVATYPVNVISGTVPTTGLFPPGSEDCIPNQVLPVSQSAVHAYCEDRPGGPYRSSARFAARYEDYYEQVRRMDEEERTRAGRLAAASNISVTPLEIYPNPTQSKAILRYRVQQAGSVSIVLNDITGHLVENILSKADHHTGVFEKEINTNTLNKGVYFIVVKTVQGTQTAKFVKD